MSLATVRASRARILAVCVLLSTCAARAAADDPAAAGSPAAAPVQADDAGRLEEIVVTASPLAGDPDRFASIVGLVDRDQILRNGGANLADALADVPGVTGTGFAAGASRPVIRGFDANRVKILEDGVGSFDVSDIGPDHGVPIDPLAAQSIEVVRGTATLRYGSQAIGGVVNAINNRVPRTRPDEPLSGELTGGYGTGADARQGSLLVDAGSGDFAFHADGFRRRAGDYDIPGGVQSNSFFEGSGWSLGGSWFPGADDSHAGLAVQHYDARYGIPAESSYIDMHQDKALLRGSIHPGGGLFHTLNVDGGVADYEHSEKAPGLGAVATFRNREWDGRAEGLMDAFGPFSAGALGIEVQNRDFSALGDAASYLLPTQTRSAAAFAFAESLLTDDLHLQLGARIERVSVRGTPVGGARTTRDFTPVSGSVGLLWELSDAVRLGLTASSAGRAPGQTELFARGPHDGPNTYETGSPGLGIERANSLESTVRVRAGRFSFEGALWAARFQDYIYGALAGASCDESGLCGPGAGPLKQLFYEQRSALFRGLEGKGRVTLLESGAGELGAQLLFDAVRATLGSDGNVPRIPPWHAGLGLVWLGDRLDAGVQVRYAGRQDRVGPTESATDGYLNLDANVTLRPFAADPDVQLALIGSNLTDSTQRNAIALNRDEVVMPGRSLRIELRAQF